jgi:3-oxoacyl-[acyl-carrier protein] reductase
VADLEGRTVLVTGGSRGIGRATVRMLVADGARVAFSYASSEEDARALVAELGEDRCRAIACELSDPAAVDRLWDAALGWQGRVDVLVNNAATRPALALDADTASWNTVWQHTLQVNLVAASQLARNALAHFRAVGGGVMVHIASRPAFRGDRPEFLHDGASKAGLVALSRGIARFFSHENVLSYVVVPGMIDTGQVDAFVRHYGADEALREIPMKAFGLPEDVAEVVRYLASGRARYAAGATIDVSGASYFS